MIAMKPVLDLFIDANIVFLLAFGLWAIVQAAISRTLLHHNYPAQLRLMKMCLVFTIISPAIAHIAVSASQNLWPKTPITASDIAVAAYLRGEISIPALEFEALLTARGRMLDALFDGELPWVTGLIVLLLAAAAVQSVRLVNSALKVRKAVDGSYLWRRVGKVDVRLSDTVSVPFAARGFTRRYIVLPSTLVTQPRELRLILAHELQHLRDGDVEWELAFEMMRPLMFWNPAFGLWKRSFDHLRELSCDQTVIARSRVARQDYMDCLLGFCERQVSEPLPRAMHVAFFRAEDRLAKQAFRDRILALTNEPGCQRMSLIVPVLTSVVPVGVSLAAASVRQPLDWSQDRLMLSTIVNLERLEAINRR